MFETEVKDLIIENDEAKGIIVHNIKENTEEKYMEKHNNSSRKKRSKLASRHV